MYPKEFYLLGNLFWVNPLSLAFTHSEAYENNYSKKSEVEQKQPKFDGYKTTLIPLTSERLDMKNSRVSKLLSMG